MLPGGVLFPAFNIWKKLLVLGIALCMLSGCGDHTPKETAAASVPAAEKNCSRTNSNSRK